MIERLLSRTVFLPLLALLLGFATELRAGEFLFVDNFEDTATLTGRVLDTNAFVDDGVELPVEGVVVRLLGVSGSSVTGPDGFFILRDVPSGQQVLDLNTGSAVPAPTGDGYAGFRERIVLAGFENIARPLYLPRIDASSLMTIDPTQTTIVENPNLGISMTVVAGSAMAEDGSPFDGQLSISEVPGGLAPAALPDFLEPGLLITVQPVGVTFSPPAPITFPNFDNLPPGSETDLWSLDPELGQFAIVGTGRVSPDGQRIETISGGIVAADWHAPPPPPPRDDDSDDDPPKCKDCCPSCAGSVGSSVDLFNGGFSETLTLPGVVSMNREFAPEFVYESKRAYPVSVVPVDSGIVSRAATPNMISYRGFVADELVQDEVFIDTGTLSASTDEPFRVAVPFDNTTRATGIHDTEVRVTSIYDRSRISSSNELALTVVNGIDSPFGAGWSLAGLDRLILDAPGTIRERILLEQGDGGAIQFGEQLTGVNPDGIITIISSQDQTAPVQAGETGALADVLTDMGFASQIVDAADFSQDHVDQSRLLIWVDASFVIVASRLDIQHVPGLLLEARANGMPLYFLGSEPANFNDFTNDGTADAFIDAWLDLVHLNLASSTNGGQGVVNVLDTDHPIFDGPAGTLTQYVIDNDSDVTRGSNTGETVLASSDAADIVLVAEAEAGGRTVVQNHTFVSFQPVDFQDEIEIVVRNSIHWLLDSPSISSGFFGEGQFAAVDGDYSGIVRDPNDGKFTRVLGNGDFQLFDGIGLQTELIDRNGNSTSYAYDAQGKLQTITDPGGRTTTFAYDGNGKLQSVTDDAGRVTGFSIDGAGNLSEVTFPDSSTRGFGYDARHLMTSQTSQRGLTTQYAFDDLGFFIQSTQPGGSVRQVSAAQMVGLVDTSGGLGSVGNPAPIVRPANALSGFTDPEGRVLMAETGPFGEPVGVSGLDDLVTVFERDKNGNPVATTLPSGASFNASYDAAGNLTSVTDMLVDGTITTDYDAELNLPLVITDDSGDSVTYGYDAQGNLTSITSAESRSDSFTYTPEGQLLTWIPRSGPALELTYDANQLVSTVTEGSAGNQRQTTLQRNPAGRISAVTDAEARSAQFSYDSAGRMISKIRSDGSVVNFGYDSSGNLVTITPPGGMAHVFDFTATGLVSAYQPPDIAGEENTVFTYSPADLLTRTDLPDGRSIINNYDTGARLVSQQIQRGTTTFTFDDNTGVLSNITAPGGESLGFGYLGAIPVSQSWSGTVSGTVSRSIGPELRMESESVNGGNIINFAYDADGLLTAAGELTLAREADSGRIAATSLDMIDDTYTYNSFGELVDYTATVNGNPLFAYSLTRDSIGRVIARSETIIANTTTFAYDYDDFGRLQQEDRNAVLQASYTYDANGNRLTRNDGSTTETGSYDVQDRLVSYGGASYVHRQSGELQSRTNTGGTTSYDYDETGNLITVTQSSGTAIDYVIDGVDRRIGKRINGTLMRGWLYRDQYFPVAELDGNGQLVSRFVYASRDQVPDYMVRDGITYRIITDQIGSVRLVVNAQDGSIAQRLEYDGFGRVLMDTNPGFQPFGFAGGMYDADTGLVRFDARDYDAVTGRWTAKDPILFEGGSMNLYAYVESDPLNRTDFTGLSPNSSGPPVRVLAATIIDVDGPRLWVLRKGSDGVRRRFQICMGQSVFLGDQLLTDPDTRAVVEFYIGGRAGVGTGSQVEVITMESLDRVRRGGPLSIDPNFGGFFEGRQDPQLHIQTAGGVIGIEG